MSSTALFYQAPEKQINPKSDTQYQSFKLQDEEFISFKSLGGMSNKIKCETSPEQFMEENGRDSIEYSPKNLNDSPSKDVENFSLNDKQYDYLKGSIVNDLDQI